jgi:hypothetical protein
MKTALRKFANLDVSSALDESVDDFFVPELDGVHQRSVVVPIADVNSGSVLKKC